MLELNARSLDAKINSNGQKSAELVKKIDLKMQIQVSLSYFIEDRQWRTHMNIRLEETDYSSLKFSKQWEVGQTDFRSQDAC